MSVRPTRRDLRATLIAATATLVTVLLNGPNPEFEGPAPDDARDPMRGLIASEQARVEGAWLIDEPDARVRLSFAPQYERLVWRVDGRTADVLIDAETGETLELSFE